MGLHQKCRVTEPAFLVGCKGDTTPPFSEFCVTCLRFFDQNDLLKIAVSGLETLRVLTGGKLQLLHSTEHHSKGGKVSMKGRTLMLNSKH